MEKTEFNGVLGFWDYLTIAFYTKFRPSKLAEVGPVRGTLWALPNGKTFVRMSPRLQEVKPLPASGPLPMPAGSVVPGSFEGQMCTSASFELDDEFEASIQKRDADELAARERARAESGEPAPNVMENLKRLVETLDMPKYTEAPPQDDIQKAAEDLVTGSAGVDLIHTTDGKKEQ